MSLGLSVWRSMLQVSFSLSLVVAKIPGVVVEVSCVDVLISVGVEVSGVVVLISQSVPGRGVRCRCCYPCGGQASGVIVLVSVAVEVSVVAVLVSVAGKV